MVRSESTWPQHSRHQPKLKIWTAVGHDRQIFQPRHFSAVITANQTCDSTSPSRGRRGLTASQKRLVLSLWHQFRPSILSYLQARAWHFTQSFRLHDHGACMIRQLGTCTFDASPLSSAAAAQLLAQNWAADRAKDFEPNKQGEACFEAPDARAMPVSRRHHPMIDHVE